MTSIEDVVNKLEGQLRKHKQKLQKRNQDEAAKFNLEGIEGLEDDVFQPKSRSNQKICGQTHEC